MKFLDEAKVSVKSGQGGDGCVSFRREKYVEFGGPDGGDGGKGGDVIIECVNDLNTLIDFRYQQHFKGQRGIHGMGKNRTGQSGGNIVLKVPVGTQVLDEDKKTLIFDMTEVGQRKILCRGGDGGRGNARFKTSVNQAPRQFDPGWPGEERWVWLRLKMIADVGLIGLPNAGKSTFLAAISGAHPKVANYPFTTLHPNLGVVSLGYEKLVVADIPGLIKGANDGAGLGTRFLGHIERCQVLLHLIDGTAKHIADSYLTVRDELKAYGADLSGKIETVVLNKCDAILEQELVVKRLELAEAASISPEDVCVISGVSRAGVQALIYRIFQTINANISVDEDDAQVSQGFTP